MIRIRGWRAKFDAIADRARRAAHVGNYWYWLDVPALAEGIEIASLVSPLRYDVVLRREFFPFYLAHQDLYDSDFEAFANLAMDTQYYTWYTQSEVIRCSPYRLNSDELLRSGFVEKIRGAVELYESMMARGFDPQFPIVLRTAERLLPPTADRSAPPTGKEVSARYFLADGCHRLAMLIQMGYEVLPAAYFRVQCFREFSPFDSTSLLAQSLPIQPAAYFDFLSSHYCAPFSFATRDEFVKWINENRPSLCAEVLSVMRVDGFEPASLKGDSRTSHRVDGSAG
jgi:hypothetical protein